MLAAPSVWNHKEPSWSARSYSAHSWFGVFAMMMNAHCADFTDVAAHVVSNGSTSSCSCFDLMQFGQHDDVQLVE